MIDLDLIEGLAYSQKVLAHITKILPACRVNPAWIEMKGVGKFNI